MNSFFNSIRSFVNMADKIIIQYTLLNYLMPVSRLLLSASPTTSRRNNIYLDYIYINIWLNSAWVPESRLKLHLQYKSSDIVSRAWSRSRFNSMMSSSMPTLLGKSTLAVLSRDVDRRYFRRFIILALCDISMTSKKILCQHTTTSPAM